MKHQIGFAASSLALVLLAACSTAPSAPAASLPAMAKGSTLVSTEGNALYVFKKDVVGKSACVRDCLKFYQPLFAKPDDKAVGDYAIFERPDGMSQWAYKGQGLYSCTVPALKKDASKKDVEAAQKKADGCAKGLTSDWVAAKP
ncbi:hypothetical protein GCM10027046_27080 [Uliginosibacterium flavum]|uniref:Lipoprotein n=1 Tax=Uliginosibacterium flavum TaxID=1396831 RepID=A0ABV2TJT6_9RHOO